MKKETYGKIHRKILDEFREQLRLKNQAGIMRCGERLRRLRRRYRRHFAS